MPDKCPKCGASLNKKPVAIGMVSTTQDIFACGSYILMNSTEELVESPQCLRKQLAARDARIAELEEALRSLANANVGTSDPRVMASYAAEVLNKK